MTATSVAGGCFQYEHDVPNMAMGYYDVQYYNIVCIAYIYCLILIYCLVMKKVL